MATIPKISSLSGCVIRVLGCNPGKMTLQGTNTYLIGTGKTRILLDTGEADKPEYISLLRKVLADHKCSLQSIILSHWHADHIGGVKDILRELKPECSIYKLPRKDIAFEHLDESFKYLKDGDVMTTDGATVKVIATPGHTDDHLVLLLEEENAIFSGDCILGEGTAVFEDLYTYMKSLEHLLELNPNIIYPGHGPVVEEPSKKIKDYIQHRLMREKQIIECLEKAKPDALSIEELVKMMYHDVPVHLHAAAAFNVSHHVSKLLKESVISEIVTETSRTENDQKYVLYEK